MQELLIAVGCMLLTGAGAYLSLWKTAKEKPDNKNLPLLLGLGGFVIIVLVGGSVEFSGIFDHPVARTPQFMGAATGFLAATFIFFVKRRPA